MADIASLVLLAAGAAIDARVAEADARIAGARNAALGEIEAVATDAAADIAARLAGLTVDRAAGAAAVKEALNG